MSGMDELKLKYTEENPDSPSDDVETMAFRSTPHKPKSAVRRKPSKAAPPAPPAAVELTMGLAHGVPTPNELEGALWLATFAVTVALAATGSIVVIPFFVALTAIALAATARPVTMPVLRDMERRFGLTVVEVSGSHVRFLDSKGRLREGTLRVYGRRATLFDDLDGSILSA